jgi:hypothetical protein
VDCSAVRVVVIGAVVTVYGRVAQGQITADIVHGARTMETR